MLEFASTPNPVAVESERFFRISLLKEVTGILGWGLDPG